MTKEGESSELLRAVKHPANYKPIIFCSISLIAFGMLMIVLGFVTIIIDHAEKGPPHYDRQYERYVSTSIAHIVGPMLIACGSLVVLGNIVMLGYATKCYYNHVNHSTKIKVCSKPNSTSRRRQDYNDQV